MSDTFGALALRAAGMGALSGMRSMAGLAVLAGIAGHDPDRLEGGPLRLLATPQVRLLIFLAALGELGIDKLPILPDRIAPGALAGRMTAGALAGAGLFGIAKQPALIGAAVGAAGAFVGAHAGYRFRIGVSKGLGLPDLIGAVVEDAFVVGAGRALAGSAGE